MKAITVRNLPPPVARAIEQKAKKDKTSLNQTVIGLLAEATGHGRGQAKRKLHHDFDKFAGRWSKAEADEFDAHLKEMRRVDPKDWE